MRTDTAFSVNELRAAVPDLFARRRWIYWTDFIVTYAVFWAALIVGGTTLEWWTPLLWFVASIAVYRLGGFIHEIIHFSKGEFRSFNVAWNVLFGTVSLSPACVVASLPRVVASS